MNSNLKGNIGESVALKYFIENGYEVYIPFGTASSADFIVYKDGETKRVSVKSGSNMSKSGKCQINIRQQYRKKSIPFNNNTSDLLFAYSTNLDKYKIFESKNIVNRNILSI